MNRERDSKFDLLAVLLLLCIFSVAILSLLLTGAGTYKNLTKSGQGSQDTQTEALYISNRIFQAESRDRMEIETIDGVQCLCIYEDAAQERYVTRVYCSDGWIRELYSSADVKFDPAYGEKIMQAQSLSFSVDFDSRGLGYLLWAEIDTDSGTQRLPYAWKGAYNGYEK